MYADPKYCNKYVYENKFCAREPNHQGRCDPTIDKDGNYAPLEPVKKRKKKSHE